MHQRQILFTRTGYKNINQEYEDLLSKRKSDVLELTIARDMGDRSENAAYKSARRKLSSTDSRLRFLKRVLSNAKIASSEQNEYVAIGSIVTVNIDGTNKELYIVGEHEADPLTGKVSYLSPVGRALMGKRIGDNVTVDVPSGSYKYLIIEISVD